MLLHLVHMDIVILFAVSRLDSIFLFVCGVTLVSSVHGSFVIDSIHIFSVYLLELLNEVIIWFLHGV
jgi:hypothetical protein